MPQIESTLSFRRHPSALSEAAPRFRCSLSLEADRRHNAFARSRDRLNHMRHIRQQIGKSIAVRLDQDDRQAVFRQVLLKGEIAVDRDKDIELLLGQRQQFAVRDATPTLLMNGACLEPHDVRSKVRIDAFVEQHPYAASFTASWAARSRKAMTC